MNKPRIFLLIALMVIASVLMSACNNPAASEPAGFWPWTWGDKTWSQTRYDAEETCIGLGQELIAVNPENGEPWCGTIAFSIPSMSGETTNTPALQPQDQLPSVCDFTTQNAKDATGVDVQRIATEDCGFVWRAVDKATENAVCPSNMVCTLHLTSDKKVVVKGDGKSYAIVAGTFRIASAYPLDDAVRDVCRLLAKEQAFGAAEVPSFTVEAGNFSCP